jgi:hypothetical protein
METLPPHPFSFCFGQYCDVAKVVIIEEKI